MGDTPKYGLIYHAQLVSQSGTKLKGKVSRMLAAKASLACRVDALGEETNTVLGIEHRAKVESRIRQLEGGEVTKISATAKQSATFDKYESKSEVLEYKAAADVTLKRKADEEEEKPDVKRRKRRRTSKRRRRLRLQQKKSQKLRVLKRRRKRRKTKKLLRLPTVHWTQVQWTLALLKVVKRRRKRKRRRMEKESNNLIKYHAF